MNKSSVTGKFVSNKELEDNPRETYKVPSKKKQEDFTEQDAAIEEGKLDEEGDGR